MRQVDKQKLVEQVILKLQGELLLLNQAAQTAYEAATHEESKAEDQHDTRGLEASYLAGAQASRAAELDRLISIFRSASVRPFASDEAVGLGAVAELEVAGRRQVYFLVGQGGGLSVEVEGCPVQILTPAAPLGEELLGKRVGDLVEIDAQGSSREYRVTGIL